MAEFLYAVHTDVCTYLLDENGIVTWVLSPNPQTSKLMVCMGAQFVACVDPRVEGAIVGELKEGARALFVAISKDTGRAQLLRTGPIRRVQYREGGESIDLAQGLDVLEEVELELDDEPAPAEAAAAPTPATAGPQTSDPCQTVVEVHKPVRRVDAALVAPEPRTVIITEPAQPAPKLSRGSRPQPAVAAPRGIARTRSSPSEQVGQTPRKQSADDTLKISVRKKK